MTEAVKFSEIVLGTAILDEMLWAVLYWEAINVMRLIPETL